MANYVSYNDLNQVVTKIGNKFRTLNGAYVIKGSKTFAELPAIADITASMVGYVYNISDDFTIDDRFIEYVSGETKSYSAGTNVVIVNNGDGVTDDFKLDVVSSFVDVAGINELIEAISDMITADDFDKTQSYSEGDIVKYNNVLYQFTADYDPTVPGADWDPSIVNAVDVISLIGSAGSDPESLTPEQLNTILGLLD